MKKQYLYLGLLLGLMGCSQNEPISQAPKSEGVSFTSSIGISSRATDTEFEEGDEISVFGVEMNQNPVSSDNIKYIYQKKGFVAENIPVYYPEDGSPLSFCAIYPYNESISYNYDFSVKLDQSEGTNYTKSDLMVAKTDFTTDLTPHLQFRHRLSSVLIEIKNELKNFEIASVQLSEFATSLRYDIEADNIISIDDVDNLTMAHDNGYYKVVFPPQTKVANVPFIVVNGTNTETGETLSFTWNLKKNTNFKSGIRHQYQLFITSTGLLIEDKGTEYIEADITPWIEPDDIEAIVTPEILDSLVQYMPIYRGDTPPMIEGAYLMEPYTAVYCQDYGHGGYEPGHVCISEQIRFYNQNNETLTLDFEEKSSISNSKGYGSFISGSGNNFTVYFDSEGQSNGIYTKMADVYSGTITTDGIKDLYHAFVMVEKGDDPNHILMDEGVFRLFYDSDGLASNYPWDTATRSIRPELYSAIMNVKNINR